MRWATLASLTAAATAALSSPAAGAKNDDKRLERVSFMLILVVGPDGSRHLETIESNKLLERQKKLDEDYGKTYKLWAEECNAFCKDPANRGKKFREPAPRKPSLNIMKRSLKGKTKANETLKWYEKNWLRPLLEKEEKILAKMRNKAGGQREEAGGGWDEPAQKKLPKGNLIKNGAFEDVNPDTRFARGWSQGQWGKKGGSYRVRADKSNPHGGNQAVSVRVSAEGAKAGVSATLTLDPGTYEVRYWASCDVGKTVSVGATFARKELTQNSVGEDWRQFKQRVVLDRRQFNASLRLWTTTPGARVFFDDVEVEAVQ